MNSLFVFPGGSDSKASACNAVDLGSIPGSGRSPGEGNGNPFQYSCLENPMDRGTCWVTVCGVAKSRTRLSDFTSLILCPNNSSGEKTQRQSCSGRVAVRSRAAPLSPPRLPPASVPRSHEALQSGTGAPVSPALSESSYITEFLYLIKILVKFPLYV